jgi:Acyl-protein synthetase, LuxE
MPGRSYLYTCPGSEIEMEMLDTATIRQPEVIVRAGHGNSHASPLLAELEELTEWHARQCPEYKRILSVLYPNLRPFESVADVPFLPVRLFKMLRLASVPAADIVKTMTSSGTSSQTPSRIYLDRPTALAQSKALISIVKTYLGTKRLPMAIIDYPGVLSDRTSFSARGAGILGFSQFGRESVYLLDEHMRINATALDQFLEANVGRQVFLFGFTFMVWRYLYQACCEARRTVDFGDSVLIHGGGWKKLANESVSNEKFKQALTARLGIRRVHNYYAMVEQTGSIFMECERGFFHPSSYSDVIVRDPITFEVLPFGTPGLLQLLSNIPRSYPGHSLLTEDMGTIIGENDCKCCRSGKYFTVDGRLARAEQRGCSDTHEESSKWSS